MMLFYVRLLLVLVTQAPRVLGNKLAIWLGVHQCPECEGTGRVMHILMEPHPTEPGRIVSWPEEGACQCVTFVG